MTSRGSPWQRLSPLAAREPRKLRIRAEPHTRVMGLQGMPTSQPRHVCCAKVNALAGKHWAGTMNAYGNSHGGRDGGYAWAQERALQFTGSSYHCTVAKLPSKENHAEAPTEQSSQGDQSVSGKGQLWPHVAAGRSCDSP